MDGKAGNQLQQCLEMDVEISIGLHMHVASCAKRTWVQITW